MVDERLKHLRGPSRRDFLRWSATVAALLGLDRARYLNVVNDTAGQAAAEGAQCARVMRSIVWTMGSGGFANMQLLIPHTAVARGNIPSYAFHAMGRAV